MPSLPENVEQNWGMNIWRVVRRSREETVWNALNPTQDGMVNQGGELRGIVGIDPPPRIALFPYVSAYATTARDDAGERVWGTPINGGLDAKLGLGDAFTLDMTLVPDFGQVVTDNLVLNLSLTKCDLMRTVRFFLKVRICSTKVGSFTAAALARKANL